MATTNGSPWQYPTCGSYLPKLSNEGHGLTLKKHSQRVCLENIKQVLLAKTFGRREKGMVGKRSSEIPHDSLFMGAGLFDQREIQFLCRRILRSSHHLPYHSP